jgi:hypothetical protein
MIGLPSISDEKEYNEEWGVTSYNFGWIYEGLKAISLLPYSVEAYRAFLETHKGHRLVLTTDHDEESPDIDWDNLSMFQFSGVDFVEAVYEMECIESGEKINSSTKELFRKFEERSLSEQDIEIIFTKIFNCTDCFDSFHHPPTSVDPYEDLESIGAFLNKNKEKTIIVRLVS